MRIKTISAVLLVMVASATAETPITPALKSSTSVMPPHASSTSVGQGDKPFSTIDADNLNYDYDKRTAVFEGHVVAIDPQMKLTCGRMVVYFDEKTNEVLRVEAFVDVHMFNEGKEAIGEKAVFTRETGMIVLSGGNPRLRDEKGNLIFSRGAGIIYNINTKQMKVDKPTINMVTSPSGPMNGGATRARETNEKP